MAFVPAADSRLVVGQINLSSYFADVESSRDVTVEEVTTIADAAEAYIVVGKSASVSGDGYWDGDSGAIDAVLEPTLAAAAGKPLSYAPAGFTVGNAAQVGDTDLISYDARMSGFMRETL